jgi:hypothetical protein
MGITNFFQRFYRTDYMIAYRFLNQGNGLLIDKTKKFIPFKNNNNYWYADPILYEYDCKIYMFYEAYNKKKDCGEIGVATVVNNHVVDKKIIIKEPFHMSYPFVFDVNGKIYMIPETSSVKKLLLYEAVNFPYQWKLSKVILENLDLSDATILKHHDKMYLFVSKLLGTNPYSDELLLYTLNEEFNLIPHKCNPIIIDNEFSRPAGRIFQDKGRMIRVSQDCSNGGYGKAIKFNEIVNLSENDYHEKNISTILPGDLPIKFHKKLTGAHSYGKCGDFEVIDVRYSVFDLKKLFTFLFKLPYKITRKSLTVALKRNG